MRKTENPEIIQTIRRKDKLKFNQLNCEETNSLRYVDYTVLL